MEESDSMISESQNTNYFDLLRAIDKLFNLSTTFNNNLEAFKENWNTDEIETIFNNITRNLETISGRMVLGKRSMFFIMVLNAILRISIVDGFDYFMTQDSFQKMFRRLSECVSVLYYDKEFSPVDANNILDSIFTNFAKNGFIETCLKRLISNVSVPDKDSVSTTNGVATRSLNFRQIMIDYLNFASRYSHLVAIRSGTEFNNNYGSIMISLQKFVTDCLTSVDGSTCFNLLEVVTCILCLIWNLTDKIALVPMFIEIGYITKTIQWITTNIFNSHIDVLGGPVFSIVHNLSRDKMGLKQLRTERAFDVLIKCKRRIHELDQITLTTHFGMTVIGLSTNDDQSEENKQIIVDATRHVYIYCQEASKNEQLQHDGYHLSELLELLHRSFSNTYVIKYFLDNETHENPRPIQYFMQLFLLIYGIVLDPEPDELENYAIQFLLKILLQISSYSGYLKELMENSSFYFLISSLSNRPRQDTIKRIWCNMLHMTTSYEQQQEKSHKIYINYDSADEAFCREFINTLRSKTMIPIWVDYENVKLSEDVWEHSLPVIQSAIVIIVLLSSSYGDNTNKLQELSYINSIQESNNKKYRNLIVIEAEPKFNFNRSWMTKFLHDKPMISYDVRMDSIVDEVCEQISIPEKSLINCFSCSNQRAQTTRSRVVKSDPRFSSRSNSSEVIIQKDSSNTTELKHVIATTRKYNSNPIVPDIITQIGSSDSSDWV